MNTIALLQAGGSGAFIIQILPIAAIFLVFYFIVIAPANKQRKKTQEMLNFCARHRIGADIEVIPASKINEAYERVLASDVRYRFVIDAATLK